jgi:hypothetical protein
MPGISIDFAATPIGVGCICSPATCGVATLNHRLIAVTPLVSLTPKTHLRIVHDVPPPANERRPFATSALHLLLISLLLILLIPTSSLAQSPTPFAMSSTDQKRVQLSESVRAMVVIVGPATLRVEPPKQLLATESDRDWKIQPVGRAAVLPLIGVPGWECWVQRYRLDPYVTGNALRVEFAPVKVNGKEVAPNGLEITVLSSLSDIKVDNARPVTGIEELPPPPIVESSSSLWWVLAGAGVVVIGAVIWRIRRQPKPVPPGEWAIAAFERLEREDIHGEALVNGVAMVLRGFIDRRFGIPAPRLTTTELLIAAENAGWPIEVSEPLGRLLEICDRAKFAGDVPDNDRSRDLLAGGRDWVNRVCSEPRPG